MAKTRLQIKFGEKLDTPEKQQAAISMLMSLKRNAGWQFVSEILDLNIKEVENTILDGDNDMEREELRSWRDRRYYQKILRDLPDKLIQQLKEGNTNLQETVLDPYDDPLDNKL